MVCIFLVGGPVRFSCASGPSLGICENGDPKPEGGLEIFLNRVQQSIPCWRGRSSGARVNLSCYANPAPNGTGREGSSIGRLERFSSQDVFFATPKKGCTELDSAEGAQRAPLPVFRPDNPDSFSFCRHSLVFSGLPQSWYSLTIPSPACASSDLPSAGIAAFRSISF